MSREKAGRWLAKQRRRNRSKFSDKEKKERKKGLTKDVETFVEKENDGERV